MLLCTYRRLLSSLPDRRKRLAAGDIVSFVQLLRRDP